MTATEAKKLTEDSANNVYDMDWIYQEINKASLMGDFMIKLEGTTNEQQGFLSHLGYHVTQYGGFKTCSISWQ